MSTTTKLRSLPLGLLTALAATLALLAATLGLPGAASAADRRGPGPLVGEWKMTSLQVGTPGNLQEVPYSGRVIFTRGGTMSVQAMNPDTEAPDTAFTVDGYESYYGPVKVDRRAGSLTLRVRSAAVRDLVGDRLTRNFEVSRNTLVLTPADPSDGFRVTYQRVR